MKASNELAGGSRLLSISAVDSGEGPICRWAKVSSGAKTDCPFVTSFVLFSAAEFEENVLWARWWDEQLDRHRAGHRNGFAPDGRVRAACPTHRSWETKLAGFIWFKAIMLDMVEVGKHLLLTCGGYFNRGEKRADKPATTHEAAT